KQSSASHIPELLVGQAWPDLVVKPDVGVSSRQPAEQILDVFGSNDVIDSVEMKLAITPGEGLQLVDHIVGRFGSELHSCPIQTAKSTVVFHTPPAASGRFNRQQNFP